MTPDGDIRRSRPGSPRKVAEWLSVELLIDDDAWGEPGDLAPVVAGAARQLARTLGPASRAEATLALADNASVQALNREFRAKDQPTNVLSFPAPSTSTDGRRYLGDIILARETVAAEACAAAIPVPDHVRHLVMHGLLHLLGYDHQTDAEAAVMERIETRALAALGIADPHAEPAMAASNARGRQP